MVDIHIRKLDILLPPEVLIIQLKRFVYNPSTVSYIKADKEIQYPLRDFSLKPYMIFEDNSPGAPDALPTRSYVYDLAGVALHSGSMNGGRSI